MHIFSRLCGCSAIWRIFLVVACCALPQAMVNSVARAYQYRAYSQNTGNPARWQASIAGMVLDVLWIDPADGILKRSQDLANKWAEGMQVWNGAPDALDIYDIAAAIESGVDLTGANISVDGGPGPGKLWAIEGDGKVELVHDQDGSAVAALGGRPVGGTSQVLFVDTTEGTIFDGFVIVTHAPTSNEFRTTAAHEIGHLLGISHSAVAMYESFIDTSLNEVDPEGVVDAVRPSVRPLMSIEGVNTLPPAVAITLSADDLAAVSALYPGPTFADNYGFLRGTVTTCSDPAEPRSGVNVRAIDVADPRVVQIGRWTGYDGNANGGFEIAVPRAGSYRLAMESLGVAKSVGGSTISYRAPGLRINTPTTDRVTYEYLDVRRIELKCNDAFPPDVNDARVARFRGKSVLIDDLDFKVQPIGGAAMLIDTSASMAIELDIHVRSTLLSIIDDWEATQDPFPTVAIQTFDDLLRDLVISNDPVTLRDAISGLVADGGFACGEVSNEALVVMGRMLEKGTTVLLLTDEPGDPNGPSREEIVNLYRAKGLSIRTLLTGDCGGLVASASSTAIASPNISSFQTADNNLSGEESTLTDSALGAATTQAVLGEEDPTVTYSALAAETGGSFLAIAAFGEPNYKQAILDAANSAFVPTVSVVTPWRWAANIVDDTVLDVEITGANTNFNDTSMLSFNLAGIVLNSMTVESPRRITANITVPSGTTAGKVTVTTDLGGGEVEITATPTFQNFRWFPVSVPTITSLAPPRVVRDETRDITIRGVLTNFVDGLSTVDFGPGVTVNLLQVQDPLTAIANITVDPAAPMGLHAVTVTTGAEVATNLEISAFQVMPPPEPIPRLDSVTPTFVLRGQTTDLAIAGVDTMFADQVSFLDLVGEGITVNSVTVTSATQATANVTVAVDAPLGYRDAIMVTGGEDALLVDAFTVSP